MPSLQAAPRMNVPIGVEQQNPFLTYISSIARCLEHVKMEALLKVKRLPNFLAR